MRLVGRAVWAFVAAEGGLPLSLLTTLLLAAVFHIAFQRWP